MRHIIKYLCFSAFFLLAVAACKEETPVPEPLEGSGVSAKSWQGDVEVDEEGEVISLTFVSAGKWTAESSDPSWCSVITPEGVPGEAALRISVAANVDADPRDARILIKVEGYPLSESFAVRQEEGVTEKGSGVYREINEWTFRRMSEVYLWNEHIPDLALDYSVDYQAFLKSMLEGIAGYDDVNHDDGAYSGKMRTEFYTKILSNAPLTKTVGNVERGNGFFKLAPVDIGTAIGVVVEAVVPGGPADEAGIERGHFITEVNGVEITRDNYKSVTSKIYSDHVSVLINSVEWQGEYRDKAVLTVVGTVDLIPDSYEDPAIYKSDVVTLSDGKKVGYLLYMGFHADYDEQLIEVFDGFKAAGVEDLILDLRYNNGGEIISSTVLSTLIAGDAHKDKILANLKFNASRTAEGKISQYRIGNPVTAEYPDGYPLIEEALSHSLGLDRVFVIATGYTASASEIIINGLRGIDIEVNLVGTTTSGKNVGMEGFSTSYRNYEFLLYPVSFYIENAKGFSDYPDGFKPDLTLDDSSYYPGGDFGSMGDFLCNAAYAWIMKGYNPAKPAGAAVKSLDMDVHMMTSRPGGSLVRTEALRREPS